MKPGVRTYVSTAITLSVTVLLFIMLGCSSSESDASGSASNPLDVVQSVVQLVAAQEDTTPTPRQLASGGDTPTCKAGQFEAHYFDNYCFLGPPRLVTCEDAPLARGWGSGSPGPGIPVDLWAARWVGNFSFKGDGAYLFEGNADDSIRVMVDDNTIIDDFTAKAGLREAWADLSDGPHKVTVEFIDYRGDASIDVKWTRADLLPTPTATFTPTPTPSATPVSCPTDQYLAQYYANPSFGGAPDMTLCENAPLARGWSKSPGGRLGKEEWSARYSGKFNFGTTGRYVFKASADDGVRVALDGRVLLDDLGGTAGTRWFCTDVTSGLHDVRVDFVQHGGGSSIEVNWTPGDEWACRERQTPTPTPSPTPTPDICPIPTAMPTPTRITR